MSIADVPAVGLPALLGVRPIPALPACPCVSPLALHWGSAFLPPPHWETVDKSISTEPVFVSTPFWFAFFKKN